MDDFKTVLNNGTPPPAGIRYHGWAGQERAKMMKSQSASQVAQQTAPRGTVAAGTTKKLGKRALKIVPFVGLVFLPGDIQAKGTVWGTANTLLDMAPGVGAGKFLRELYDGKDMIPDKPPKP